MVDLFRRLAERRRDQIVVTTAGNCGQAPTPSDAKPGVPQGAGDFLRAPLFSTDAGEIVPVRHVLAQPFCIVAELLCVLFAGVLVISRTYTDDAALFPTIVGIVGVGLCVIFLMTALFEPDFVAANMRDMEERVGNSRGFWVAFVSSPLYCLAIDIVGFHVATFVAIVGMPAMLGYRKYLRLILVALAGVIVLHLVFVSAVQIDLPNGLVGDYLLQRFVYQP